VNGRVSDASHIEFGIREVTSEIDVQGHRLFHINGKNILIRGAGYTFDMLLRAMPERQEAELRYVRDMNLNAVRFEGKLEDDHFRRHGRQELLLALDQTRNAGLGQVHVVSHPD
jgi:exo-1,4-beta-D-glucosaminidase